MIIQACLFEFLSISHYFINFQQIQQYHARLQILIVSLSGLFFQNLLEQVSSNVII